MDRLPPELVIATLKHLDHADLRSVAAVSGALYASAWQVGLYIHRTVHLYNGFSRGCTNLEEIFQHVLLKDLRLSLSVHLSNNSGYYGLGPSPAHRILALISSVLPVLVNLSITTADAFVPALMAALNHPAPRLAAFRWGVIRCGHPVQQVTADLFARSAPKLRRLDLSDTSLGPDLVPAFCLLDSVRLAYSDQILDVDYALQFPHLKDFHISTSADSNAAAPCSFKFEGLRLRRLTVGETTDCPLIPAIRASLDLGAVAHVKHITRAPLEWADPLWERTDDGLVSMRVTAKRAGYGLEVGVVIVPAHRRWRRAYTVSQERDADVPLLGIDMPGSGDRIVYLRIDNTQIRNLLMCRGVVLRALHRLQVDVRFGIRDAVIIWPPALECPAAGDCMSTERDAPAGLTWHYVDCSALETLMLYGMEPGLMVVESDEVVYLSRALSQCQRRENDRAALELVGMRLTDIAPVAQAFSAVRMHCFVDYQTPLGRDEGLWDDDD